MSDLPPGVDPIEEELPEGVDPLPPGAGPIDFEEFNEKFQGNVREAQLKQSLDETGKGMKNFGHGLRHSAALGWDDEIGGAVQAGLQAVTGEVKDEYGNPVPALDVYRSARNGNRMEEANLRADSQGEYGLGEVAGILAPTNQFGGKGPAQAAATGALAGLGNSEADLTQGEYGHAAFDATTGAALGLGGQKLGEYVGGKAGDFFNWASKKLGKGQLKAAGKILSKAEADEWGRFNKETGALGPPEAEGMRKLKVLREHSPDSLADPDIAQNVQELLERQIPKAEEVLTHLKPPAHVNPVTDESVEAVAGQIRKEGWEQASGNFWGDIGKAIVKDLDKIPGGSLVKTGLKYGARAAKKYANPVTTEAFFKKAKEILQNDPEALGHLGKVILTSQDTAVTDFVMSQSDPAWRELKEKLTGEEETQEESTNKGHIRVLDPGTGKVLYEE